MFKFNSLIKQGKKLLSIQFSNKYSLINNIQKKSFSYNNLNQIKEEINEESKENINSIFKHEKFVSLYFHNSYLI